MAHFAKLDENNVVTEVVVVSNNVATTEDAGVTFLRNLYKEPTANWKQTSYNTKLGKYLDYSTTPPTEAADQSKAFRLNFAGIGWVWNEEIQGFVEGLQPYASWTLDTSIGMWQPPIPNVGVPYTEWNETAYQADNTKGWEDKDGNPAP
jgi:hypothetical protein